MRLFGLIITDSLIFCGKCLARDQEMISEICKRQITLYFMILCRVHFLDGIYTSEDLKQQVGKTVPTIGKTKWGVQSKGRVTIT